jgi:hypothetical protein
MRIFPLFVLLMLLSLGAAAQTARLQAIHNSPSPTVDIWVNGAPFLTNFQFRSATPFIDVVAGVELEIGIAPSPSSSPADIIATFPVTFDDGGSYVILAHGVVGDMSRPFDLAIFDMGQEGSGSGSVALLAFHGSPDAPSVDIAARGVGNLVGNLDFAEFQGYLEVPAGDYILDISPAGSGNVVATFAAPLSGLGGGAAVVFASGFLGQNPSFGLFAALPTGDVVALPAITDARLQVIHNSPSPTVDIWVNDQPFLTDFAFREATPFVSVPANTTLNIGVAPSPSSSPADIIATFPVNFLAGETYTVIANGIVGDPARPFNLEVFASSRETAEEGVNLLVFHGSPDAPAVDIAVRGVGNVVESLDFADYAGYLEVPAADYILDIKAAGDDQVLLTYAAPLEGAEGSAITVFASGYLGNDPAFGLFAAFADGSVVELPAITEARVQIIHNSPSPTVDIWVNDQPFLTDFAFREATPFVSVPGNTDLTIGVAPSPSSSPADIIATFPVNFLAGETYTVIANGIVGDPARPFNLEVFASSRETAEEGVNLLVFHGSPDAPAVDIAVRGVGNVVESLDFADYAGYLEVPAADYILDIKAAGDDQVLLTYAAPLEGAEGAAITVFASGYLGNDPGFGLFAAFADGSVVELPALSEARVQIIHNSPSPTVDIWVNDQPFLTNFAFREATPYVSVPGNTDLTIGVAPSPSSSPADIIATFDVNFLAGGTYTVIANGVVGDPARPFNLEVFTQSREEATDADEVNILVFHGSPDAPAVDIAVRGVGNVVEDLDFADFAGYLEVPAGDYILDIKAAGTEPVLLSYLAPLEGAGGVALTVFASGFLGDVPGFGLFAALSDGTVIELPLYEEVPVARLQIIHNSPAPTVDIWVNEEPFLTNFAFRDATPFFTVVAGVDLTIGVAPSPSSSPADIIASFEVNFTEGETFIVFANGIVGDPATPFELVIVEGAQEEAAENDKVDVLVFHGSPDAPAVDVLVNGGLPPAITDLAYSDLVGYVSLDPASYTLTITPAGLPAVEVASYTADVSGLAGGAATIFASGLLAGTPGFGLWVALADGTTFPLPLATSTENPRFGTVTVYPNPVAEQVQVRLNSLLDTRVDMTIYDLQGRAIHSEATTALTGENQWSLPATKLSTGMYILELRPVSGEALRVPLIKQ